MGEADAELRCFTRNDLSDGLGDAADLDETDSHGEPHEFGAGEIELLSDGINLNEQLVRQCDGDRFGGG